MEVLLVFLTELETLSLKNASRIVLLLESTTCDIALFEKQNYLISHQTPKLIILTKH